MRKQTLALAGLAAVAALAVAGGTLAAPALRDPTTMILRKADVPGAKGGPTLAGMRTIEQSVRHLGVRARAAAYHYAFATGPAAGRSVSGLVLACADARQATKAYAAFRRQAAKEGPATRLPAYGQAQLAVLVRGEIGADLLVRRNAVVWMLSIRAEGIEGMTRAEILAELKRYARRQQARVGRG